MTRITLKQDKQLLIKTSGCFNTAVMSILQVRKISVFFLLYSLLNVKDEEKANR